MTVQRDKDGYAIASAQFGQHSLDTKKLKDIATKGILFSQDAPDFEITVEEIMVKLREQHPELSGAEFAWILNHIS